MSIPPLLIMRHGQTEWNVTGQLQGHHDTPLTERGRVQAGALNQILKRVWPDWQGASFYASPLGRVQQTVAIALKGLAPSVCQDERLIEASAGDWEGQTERELEEQYPEIFETHQTRLALSFAAPRGESYEMVEARSAAFLKMLTGPSVIFTHGATMAVLRGLALGLEPDEVLTLDHRQGVIYAISEGRETVLEA